jgi:hypothetical protein
MILSICVGCSNSEKYGLGEDDSCPASSIALTEEEAAQITDKMPIRLYFANEDNSKLKLEIRYIPSSEANKSVNHLAQIIVNELINGPKVAGMKATIPEGTKLKSEIKIDGDVATVNFTKEFKDNHLGGKAEERMTIYSVVNSLTELKEISKVKFLIEDKSTAEFKGNFKFDAGFPRCAELISSKTEPVGMGGGNNNTSDVKEEGSDKKDDTKGDKKGEAQESDAGVVNEEDVFGEAPNEDEEWQESFDEEYEETYIEYLE